jgi:hypothetical protein
MPSPRLLPLVPLVAAGALALCPGAGMAAGRTQTLRFFDKPVAQTLTHPDGTVVRHGPLPEPQPGDVLDIDSVDYAGTHAHHARHWTMSAHIRCTFGAAGTDPVCVAHVAVGGSLLVFTGDALTDGTGIYQGATGRIVDAKELAGGASDNVVKVRLR